jgi:cytochrome c553
MISQLRRITLFSLLAISTQTFATGDVARGKVAADTCFGCHGVTSYTNVYPTYKVPKLAGQHADYLAAALKGYRSGERSHKTMRAQAARLSDQDIENIAAYFATLK